MGAGFERLHHNSGTLSMGGKGLYKYT
jgi:hypothetical protein